MVNNKFILENQYTWYEWIDLIEKEEIKIRIDGKGKAILNILIGQFRRSVNHDSV